MVGDIREQCVVAVRGGADSDVKERKKPVWLARKIKHNHLTNFAYCQEEYDDETVPFERIEERADPRFQNPKSVGRSGSFPRIKAVPPVAISRPRFLNQGSACLR